MKRRLDGDRPTPVLDATLADASATWADGLAELLQVQPGLLLEFFRAPIFDAGEEGAPLAFIRGARLAKRLFGAGMAGGAGDV